MDFGLMSERVFKQYPTCLTVCSWSNTFWLCCLMENFFDFYLWFFVFVFHVLFQCYTNSLKQLSFVQTDNTDRSFISIRLLRQKM